MKIPHGLLPFAVVLAACGATSDAGGSSHDKMTQASVAACGPMVVKTGNALVVAPTGADDTASLQCAFDKASSLGPNVRLLAGTYHISQVIASNFHGTFRGAGSTSTTVSNLSTPLVTATNDFIFALPSASNVWPSLLIFVDGEVEVSDLAIRIVGQTPTTGWSILGIEPPIAAYAHGLLIIGSEANAKIENISMSGEPAPNDLFGLNLINGTCYEGVAGGNPLSGAFVVRHSSFDTLASPVPFANVKNAAIVLEGNRINNTLLGSEIADLSHSTYVFANNYVTAAWLGIDQYDDCLGGNSVCGTDHSSLLIVGNRFHLNGIRFEGTMNAAVKTLVAGNTFGSEVNPELFMGPDIHDVLAVGISRYQDLGQNNRVVP